MYRTSRRAIGLLLLGLMAAVLTILPATPAAAAKPKLVVSPAMPVEGSRFTISGTTPNKVRTKVTLQAGSGEKWRALQTRKPDKRGRFIFSLTARRPSRTTYRVMLGRKVHASKVVTSVPRPVTTPPVVPPTDAATPPPVVLPPDVPPVTPPVVPPLPVDQLPETVPLTPAAAETLEAYDSASGVMTFGPEAPLAIRTAQPDTTIAVPISPETPYGALRKVTAVTPNPDGSTVIETTDGILAEAVAPITDQPQDVEFTHVSTRVTALADGVSVEPSPLIAATPTAALGFPVSMPRVAQGSIDGPMIGIKVANAKFNFGSGDVTFNGNIAVGPTADLHLDQQTNWDWTNTTVQVKSYKFGSGARVDAEISAEMSTEIGLVTASKEFTLAEMHHVMLGAIGALPVVIDLHQKMVMEVGANGSVGVRFETSMEGRAVGGIENRALYDTTPKLYSENPTVSSSLRVSGKSKVTAFLGAVFATNLYGGAGPEIKMGGQAEVEVEVGTPINFTPVFDWDQLELWDFVACEVKVSPHIEVELTVSDAIEGVIGKEVEVSVFAVPFPLEFHYTCPDPDEYIGDPDIGAGPFITTVPGSYSVQLAARDLRPGTWSAAPGTTLPREVQLSGEQETWLNLVDPLPGTYRFTLQFTDELGRTATRDYIITVEPLPELSLPAALYGTNVPDVDIINDVYTRDLRTTDGTPARFSIIAGALPPGVELKEWNGTQYLGGIPTTPGTYRVTIRAVALDPTRGVAEREYTILILETEPGY